MAFTSHPIGPIAGRLPHHASITLVDSAGGQHVVRLSSRCRCSEIVAGMAAECIAANGYRVVVQTWQGDASVHNPVTVFDSDKEEMPF